MTTRTRRCILAAGIAAVICVAVYIGIEQYIYYRRSATAEDAVFAFYDKLEQENNGAVGDGAVFNIYDVSDVTVLRKYKIPFVKYYTVKTSYIYRLVGDESVRYMLSSGNYAEIAVESGEKIDLVFCAEEQLLLRYHSDTWEVWRVDSQTHSSLPYKEYMESLTP